MSAPTADEFTEQLRRGFDAAARRRGEPDWPALAELADERCHRSLAAESARTSRSVEELKREAYEQIREHLEAAIAAEEAVAGE